MKPVALHSINRSLHSFILSFFHFLQVAVIWSFGHLSKSKRIVSKPPLYINIYLYIVSNDRVSEIENDHFDLDHFDHE